jgi:hypothetical protein
MRASVILNPVRVVRVFGCVPAFLDQSITLITPDHQATVGQQGISAWNKCATQMRENKKKVGNASKTTGRPCQCEG